MTDNLCKLIDLIDEMPAFIELTNKLEKNTDKESRVLILDAAKPYFIAALAKRIQVPLLVITSQPENAKKLYEQVSLWHGLHELYLFPEADTLPFQRSITDISIEQERLQVLFSLANQENVASQPVIICSAPALIQKTIPKKDFISSCHCLETGDDVDPLSLMSKWEAMGYRVENLVDEPGTISRRGGLVDIFPPTNEMPVRIEFWGNTIDSMRLFDSSTQRSQRVIDKVNICAASETMLLKDRSDLKSILLKMDISQCCVEAREQFEQDLLMLSEGQRLPNKSFYAPLFNTGNLLDYLPDNAIVILDEVLRIQEEIEYVICQAEDLKKQRLEAGELPANYPDPYFKWKELKGLIGDNRTVHMYSWVSSENTGLHKFDFIPAPNYTGQLPALIQKAKSFLKQDQRLILISTQAVRLSEMFEEEGIFAQPLQNMTQIPPRGSLTLVQGSLFEGWLMPGTYLLTDKEIFGFTKERRLIKRRAVKRHKLPVDFKPGDYVVHVEHGIGQFAGIQYLNTDSAQREYLILMYAAGDKLYVPADQIDRVSRYIGSGESTPTLSRLGTQEWNRTKQKVKESVEVIAQDLLNLYAAREVVTGHAFGEDTIWQRELEASFPYIETPDQIKVQEEVKEDMTRPKPMDRLVIGDVGYGKTEIALRAAFKAVMDNKQVAILVPTTVLAEQHHTTFKQRMGTYPVNIEVLSRFRTPKEQKRVLEGLANGSIDICIGTHRLLQKDVVFKDLGLLVIDEEQRFGVSHKEFLKKMRKQVDVLTLTATPIPRTLHMALVGVRDMSVIETPPENRLPIRNYVAEYNDQLVREAIIHELERNGQVFFVHNRVQGIMAIAARIKSLVPEAQIDIAHGQMPEELLEKVMLKFQKGETNVLVCTTIIESGLDLPNVNTLIVNRADKFGLTQLYQLRGRIGRGSNLAYAYFLYDKESRLNPVAEKRLRTIFEATELGAGFGIAMKDLEIRGAGSLLGTQQSGNISAVGFNLYTQLLAQAVEDQKARVSKPEMDKSKSLVRRTEPSLDLPFKAFISDTYISDIDIRLSIYQRLTTLASLEQVEDLSKELTDRFGQLPQETQNLLYMVKLKLICAKNGVDSITTNGNIVTVRLLPGIQFNRQRLVPFFRYGIKVGITQLIINLKQLGKDSLNILEEIIRSIR